MMHGLAHVLHKVAHALVHVHTLVGAVVHPLFHIVVHALVTRVALVPQALVPHALITVRVYRLARSALALLHALVHPRVHAVVHALVTRVARALVPQALVAHALVHTVSGSHWNSHARLRVCRLCSLTSLRKGLVRAVLLHTVRMHGTVLVYTLAQHDLCAVLLQTWPMYMISQAAHMMRAYAVSRRTVCWCELYELLES